MAVSPEDLAAGALALQVFIKNSQYVEMIVNVAFGAVPSILGIGAAGLLGSGIINTAREVNYSISLLRNLEPMIYLGGMAAGQARKGIGRARDALAERFPFLTEWRITRPFFKSPNKKGKDNQNTQSKQEEQGGGGSGGNPPPPPDIKTSDKKEQDNKAEKPRPLEPSYGFSDSLLGEIIKSFKRDNK